MKKILVISDTHIPNVALELPKDIIDTAKRVDFIIHAGDIISIDVIHELKAYAPVYAVHGNVDRYDKHSYLLPDKLIIDVEGVKIGITHGGGAPWGIIGRINKMFPQLDKLDMIIFGHTHHPLIEKRDGRLYLNPGSPTDKRFAPYNSYAIAEIDGKDIYARIIKIKRGY